MGWEVFSQFAVDFYGGLARCLRSTQCAEKVLQLVKWCSKLRKFCDFCSKIVENSFLKNNLLLEMKQKFYSENIFCDLLYFVN